MDVRAPVEFAQGHVPNAVNLPIMNDQERERVGLCYKQQGQERAIELGHSLVSGNIKARRVEAWVEFFKSHPGSFIYCFRGGLRSRLAQRWIFEAGIEVPRIGKGYKELRTSILEFFQTAIPKYNLKVISGTTGSQKTVLIESLHSQNIQAVDLEDRACHRGSAFGVRSVPQPAQAQFENWIAHDFFKLQADRVTWIEDESRLIGRSVIPLPLFENLRKSPIFLIEEPIESRAKHILERYILLEIKSCPTTTEAVYERLVQGVNRISKKLGGMQTAETLKSLSDAHEEYLKSGDPHLHLIWIQSLLKNYYDPMYLGSLERRGCIIEKRGTLEEIREGIRRQQC